jgi:hypothetical protein
MTACSSAHQFLFANALFQKTAAYFSGSCAVFGALPAKMRARKDAVHGNISDAQMFKTKGSG